MKSTNERKQAFAAIDKNGSGVISFKEWHKHFESMLKETNMGKDELAMMFNAYDEAGSTRGVDFKEYTSFMNDVFGVANTEVERKHVFAAIDKNGSGVISFKEWHKHFESMLKETNMGKDELAMMFNAYDEAGSTRGVDFKEYTSFMNDVFGADNAAAVERKQAFATIDKNGTGVISFIEWHKHFESMLKETNMGEEELTMMFRAYDEAGSTRGVDLGEYTSFMNDVFGAS